MAVVEEGVLRVEARLDSSFFVLSASVRALSATGPLVRDCPLELFMAVDLWSGRRLSGEVSKCWNCYVVVSAGRLMEVYEKIMLHVARYEGIGQGRKAAQQDSHARVSFASCPTPSPLSRQATLH